MIFTEPKLAERLNDIFQRNTDLVKGNQLDKTHSLNLESYLWFVIKKYFPINKVTLVHSLLNRNKTGQCEKRQLNFLIC